MGTVCYSLRNVCPLFCIFMAQTRDDNAIEIRLDKCRFSIDDIKEIFSTERNSSLIATYRCQLPSQVSKAVEALSAAILAGADYVDLDIQFPEPSRSWIVSLALNKGCKLITSYHDFKHTGTLQELKSIAERAYLTGADIVKIVTTAKCEEDAERVLQLYKHFKSDTLVAFAMGEAGKDSRLLSWREGAPLFYIAPRRGRETAGGQPVYFDFVRQESLLLCGKPLIPASKSYAQRAILLAAITEGVTRLYGINICDDIESALSVAVQLGAEIAQEQDTIVITGHQEIQKDGLKVRDNTLFVGESGLLARLCIPLAGLSKEPVRIIGEKTLLHRKVSEHRAALKKLGLNIEYTDKHYLPLTVSGPLKGGCIDITGIHGSQMISGLLIALSQAQKESIIKVRNVTSAPYIDLTSMISTYFGIEDSLFEDDDERNGRTYLIAPHQEIRPVLGLEVEKDWSAAAFFLVAGAIMGDITISGMDFFSDQADAVIYEFLENSDIDIVKHKDGSINVRKSIICPFLYDITDSPDLFAPLVLLALRADGESCIMGIRRLKNKESDRAATFVKEFAKLGVTMHTEGDSLYICGKDSMVLKGGVSCSSHGDHRLAMALSIASLIAESEIQIDDLQCISKSFPTFLENLEKLKRKQ